MNNEEKILSVLESVQADMKTIRSDMKTMQADIKTIQTDIKTLQSEQAKTNERLNHIEHEQSEMKCLLLDLKADTKAIYEHTAELTESRTLLFQEIDEVRSASKQSAYEIMMIKGAK